MQFRYARHTNNLQPLIEFYTQIIGLTVLGEFKNHQNYDGVFLGIPNQGWQLEFTVSDTPPQHTFDEDDLLVFYMESEGELKVIMNRAITSGTKITESKNPYWKTNGLNLIDPDGFGVVVSIRKPLST